MQFVEQLIANAGGGQKTNKYWTDLRSYIDFSPCMCNMEQRLTSQSSQGMRKCILIRTIKQ